MFLVVDLKAELFRTRESFNRDRKNVTPKVVSTKVFKKPAPSDRRGRPTPDEPHGEDEEMSKLEASWIALKRKADSYDRLKRTAGEDGEEGEAVDTEEPLVDFVKKRLDESVSRTSDPLPPPAHFDARREIRTMGVGFYGFSQDDETRRQQQQELNELRQDTTESRQRASRAKVDRATRLDERRAMLQERKRRRMEGGTGPMTSVGGLSSGAAQVVEDDLDDMLKSVRSGLE
ncbi:hypothetical protein HK405_007045 [Cladochytrium tenue]|nr:hypothetical protein HK405_007045 [Cladochytrium tenue]